MAIEVKKEATPLIKKLIHQEKEWAHFFQVCCEDGPDRLSSHAWQSRDELRNRGHELPETEIRDALLDLAAELLPNSPTGSPEAQDAARSKLLNEAMYWAGRYGVPLELDPDEVQEAWEGTLSGLRSYLKERCREGLKRRMAA